MDALYLLSLGGLGCISGGGDPTGRKGQSHRGGTK